jgi:hypothetical protein
VETRKPIKFFILHSTILLATAFAALGAFALPQEARETSDPGRGFPFQGERLVYRVDWNPPWYLFFLPSMEAGEAELVAEGEMLFQERKTLKIIFRARSSGTLARLAGVKVDDRFEILTDPRTLCTYRVSKKIREGKRARTLETVYFADSRRLHFYEVDEAVNPPAVKNDAYLNDIPECPKDLFSALYALRLKELQLDSTQKTIIGDDNKIKEVESKVSKLETVDVPAGRFPAWKIDTRSLLGGLFKDGGEFRIWLSADDRKVPIKFEVKVKLGRVEGKLKTLKY